MALRVDTGISLRSEYGVTPGRLLKVSDKQMLVTAETKFRPGAKVEFQLELEAYGATVFGIAQVSRVTAYTDAPNRYLLVISQLSSKDKQLYQRWLYDLAQVTGPASRAGLASSIVSTLGPRGPASRPPQSTPERTPRSSPPAKGQGRWSVTVGSAVSDARKGVGRAAVREALRARFAERMRSKQTTGAPPPEASREPAEQAKPAEDGTVGRYGLDAGSITSTVGSSSLPERARPIRSADAEAEFSSKLHTVPRTRTAGGGAITVTHSPEAERQFSSRRTPPTDAPSTSSKVSATPRKRKRVQVALNLAAKPPAVSLRYNDPARYRSDWNDYLSKDAIFVRWRESKPGHRAKVLLELTLPNGETLSCSGQVVALMPSGFGLSLTLDDDQRAVLKSQAQPEG